jgi:hypothetical protein
MPHLPDMPWNRMIIFKNAHECVKFHCRFNCRSANEACPHEAALVPHCSNGPHTVAGFLPFAGRGLGAARSPQALRFAIYCDACAAARSEHGTHVSAADRISSRLRPNPNEWSSQSRPLSRPSLERRRDDSLECWESRRIGCRSPARPAISTASQPPAHRGSRARRRPICDGQRGPRSVSTTDGKPRWHYEAVISSAIEKSLRN